MRAFCLCQSNMLHSYKAAAKMGVQKEEINETPNGYLFCKREPGILPTILKRLHSERNAAKKRMKSAPNEFEKNVHNGVQLALKVGK